MSDILDISAAANNARLLGFRDFLDTGSGNATLEIYYTGKPSPGGSAGGSPAVTITLAKPCGSIVANKLVLEMDDPVGYMIGSSGDAVWGRLKNGDAEWAGDGDVSDADGGGVFKLAGDGVGLFAGGYLVLGTTALE